MEGLRLLTRVSLQKFGTDLQFSDFQFMRIFDFRSCAGTFLINTRQWSQDSNFQLL